MLIISNYNYSPLHLFDLGIDYICYDQSDDQRFITLLESIPNIKKSIHTGHNISDYLSYIIENWGSLPSVLRLVKGNIYPRHTTKRYFFDNIYNKYFTCLYSDDNVKDDLPSLIVPGNGLIVEVNNNWYELSKASRYFSSFDELASLY